MKEKLIDFMKWYKKNVPIGTQKSSKEIVNDYLTRAGKDLDLKNGKLPIPRVSSRFIAITYMIYIILWEALVIGGCGYVVFGLNRSGWWMLLGVLLSAVAYKPSHWRKLFS